MLMSTFIKTIIVGCGPSGLQLGYFLKHIKQDYIILEKHNAPGSFFSQYPHSKELISINKIYTGKKDKEFNLRHDWNSLLNNFDIEMKNFSNEYYPSRDDLTKYLHMFASKHNLNIKYNTDIHHITKQDNIFILKSNNHTWTCNKLIIATGLSKPNIPTNIINVKQFSKHYSDFPKDYFLDMTNLQSYNNKKVLIIGLGNSAFEIANILTPYCSNILLLGRNPTPKPSLSTHYIGDLRSKYFHFYDTFLLKSMNAFDGIENTDIYIHKDKDNLYYLKKTCECCDYYRTPNIGFHEIINCTGWTFDISIFDANLQPNIANKYPEINGKYESTNISNLFFIGSLMHSFDYKKSSGGFIHGFRYLIDNFVKINYSNFIPLTFENVIQLTSHCYKRINISSALYQMHGQLCDIFYLNDSSKFTYYEQIPLSYLFTTDNSKIYLPTTYIFILTLEYGIIESDLRKIGSKPTLIGSESKAILLHPVLRIYNNKYNDLNHDALFYPSYTSLGNKVSLVDIIHFDEDLLTNFTNKKIYLEKLFKILKGYF